MFKTNILQYKYTVLIKPDRHITRQLLQMSIASFVINDFTEQNSLFLIFYLFQTAINLAPTPRTPNYTGSSNCHIIPIVHAKRVVTQDCIADQSSFTGDERCHMRDCTFCALNDTNTLHTHCTDLTYFYFD